MSKDMNNKDDIDLLNPSNIDELYRVLYYALFYEFGKDKVLASLKSFIAPEVSEKLSDLLKSYDLTNFHIKYGNMDFHKFFMNLIVDNKSYDKVVDTALRCYLEINVYANWHHKGSIMYKVYLNLTEEQVDNILSHNIPSVVLFKFIFYHRLFGHGVTNVRNYFYIKDKCFLKLIDKFIDDSDDMYNYAVDVLSKDTHDDIKYKDNNWRNIYPTEFVRVTIEVYGAFVAAILFRFGNLNKEKKDTLLSLIDTFFINKARHYCYISDFKYEIYDKNETDILKLTDNFNILKNGEYKPLFKVIECSPYGYNSYVDHIAILTVALFLSQYSQTAKNYFIMGINATSVLQDPYNDFLFLLYIFKHLVTPTGMNEYEYLYKVFNISINKLYEISERDRREKSYNNDNYKLSKEDIISGEIFAYTQNMPEVVYEILKINGLSIDEYQHILDSTFNKYPEIYEKKYIVNLLYALKSKDYVHFIQYFIENKEYIEDEVKNLAENGKGSAKKLAESLITSFNSQNISSSKNNVVSFANENYKKSMDKKLPFVNHLDYNSVLFKNSGETVPDYTLKYMVYEYISLVKPEITQFSLNLYEVVDIVSFNKFLDRLYSLWKMLEYPQKYKNIAVLYVIFINKDKLTLLQKDIEYLYANSRMAIGKLLISGMTLRNDDYGLSTLDRLNKKSKDKKIRKDIRSILQLVADNLNISLYELYDIILPDFGFNNRRELIFDYRVRKVKVMLNNDFTLILEDKNGKLLKSLPSYSEKQHDNEAMVETAKEEYQYIKKQVPLSIEEWSIRLLQAALLEKKYSKNKWIDMFINNPLLNIYAIKLIWQSYDSNGNLLNSFRVTEDGYFVTNDDEDINIDDAEFLTMLTPYNSSSEIIDKWKEHLEDYEITQPFNQLDLPNSSINNIDKDLVKDKKYKIKPLKKLLEKFGFEEWDDGMGIGYNVFKTITQHNCAVYICFQCNPEDRSEYIFDGTNIDIWIDNIIVEKFEEDIKPSSYMYKKVFKPCESIPQPVLNFISYMIKHLLVD